MGTIKHSIAIGRVSCSFFLYISMITWYIIIRELRMFARWRHFSNRSTQITRKYSPQDLASLRTDTSHITGNAPPYLTFLVAVWFERNEKPEEGWSPYSDPVGKHSQKQQYASLQIGIQFLCRIDKVFHWSVFCWIR